MAQRAGGKKYARISVGSLIFFILVLLGNIYMWDQQTIVKSVIHAFISTLIFACGMLLLQRKHIN